MERKNNVTVAAEELERQREYTRQLRKWNDEFERETGRKRSVFIHTYGCQMNVHDSEKLLGMLSEMGFTTAETDETADLVLFNTCCVREHAETRVYGNVGHLGKIKRQRPELLIGVCGCMMQQEEIAKDLYKKFPFVDLVFGTHALHAFPELLYGAALSGGRSFDIRQSDGTIVENLPVIREKGTSAFVTVMYGCNNFCSYCIVPYVRGRERSRLPEDILAEVEELVREGYSEITLLGQNVNSYGKDLSGGIDFAELLRRVDKVPGLRRLRFMSSHPKDLSDRLIAAMAECKTVCHHLHLPVQSGSDEILRRMNRHYTAADYKLLVEKLRRAVPDIELSTDIIVGFPGETEADFQATLALAEEVGFCAAFTFMYSPREGTPAAKATDQIPEQVKKDRLAALNALQAKKCAENNQKYIGGVYEVLVEGCDLREGCNAFGKTGTFKMIYFPGDASMIGQYRTVKVETARKNSLIGTLQEEL